MKQKSVLVILIFLISVVQKSNAASPNIQWQKAYGGSSLETKNPGQNYFQTSDGGYVTIGTAYSNDGDVSGGHGSSDYWVVKSDAGGNIQWQKMLGGNDLENAYSIKQTGDGGYIVAGHSVSNNNGQVGITRGFNDYWIVKLDASGNIYWQNTYGGSQNDICTSVFPTNDGGYIVAGYSQSNDGQVIGQHGNYDYWILKLDSIGIIQWQKTLGGSAEEECYAVQQTSDGGYIIGGFTYSNNGDVSGNHGNADFWIVKLNGAGTIQWQKALGGSSVDYCYAVRQTSDGGYIATGLSYSNDGDVSGNHGNGDYWMVKLDSIGNLQWQKTYGGSTSDIAYAVSQTTDGGYVLTGISDSNDGDVSGNHGGNDYWVLKTDASGILQWQKTLGGSNDDRGFGVQQTSDGGFIVAGYTLSNNGDVTGNHGGNGDIWVVKLFSNSIPTLSEWSLIVLGLFFLGFGVFFVLRKQVS